MNKKYIPIIFTIVAIIIATFFWERIILPYNIQNQIHGEYAINQYNPKNDILRFIFFVSLTLVVFLFSYLMTNNEKTLSLKQVILSRGEKITKQKNNLIYDLVFIAFIVFIFTEFLSVDFNKFAVNLDFFHEGASLTPSNNLDLTKGLWSSSYIHAGLFGNFGPLFIWKLFNLQTIGLIRLFELLVLLLNKILLVVLARKISKNLLFSEKAKILYFVILAIFLSSLVSFDVHSKISEFTAKTFLFLLFFLIFFNSLYKQNKFSFTFFLLGAFSTISMLWYIDIGAYINALLLLILIYFFIRSEFKKFICIFLGIFFSWLIFIFIIPNHEIKEFLSNTLLVYSTYDYIVGLIYPTPFLSGNSRMTRVLLLIIAAGILVIIVNFNKNTKLTYYNKTLFVFLFLASLLIFNSGMVRSDTPHVKAASGFTLFLLYSLGLYFLFLLIFNKNKQNIIFLKFNNFLENYTKLFLVFILTLFVILKNDVIDLKNMSSSMNKIVKLANYKDEKYLSPDYSSLVKYYKNLIHGSACVHILTNETALPYLLKKPTCTQFYFMWDSGPNQKKMIKQLKESKPQIVLYSSEIDPYNDVFERTPLVIKYINQNYSFHSKFKFWTFVEINQ